ncbi:FAD-binding oxidoreductase [Palleronia sediminis]|uniref:FAD-binding oxidoreductase n=1 Tax=Palleronia sediminis TaxID=2547833 RepID=A0A4R6A1K9_9RHOB|nr:FAD-binding oxidoreductase [Palleronia sediminis]TDL76307.1 FAD-binding oxidoreductase [Palleronia sediminis]
MRWKTAEYAGWGRALRAKGRLARPERQAELARLIATSPAPVLGARRSYGDACLNPGGDAILSTRLDRVLEFDTQTGEIEVEPGLTLADLLRLARSQGFLPPVLPGTGHATVGGAVAMDVHGKNHHRAGSFGQHVTALTLLTGDGPLRLHPGEAAFLATIGGLGQTGPIARVRIQLERRQAGAMRVTETRAADWDALVSRLAESPAEYAVAWIDATARGAATGRGIVEEAAPTETRRTARERRLRVPLDAPRLALAPPVVRLFNAAYLARVPKEGRTRDIPCESFYFPLDGIADWNRLYGRNGFHQFQCVLPEARLDALRAIFGAIVESGLASPLSVLKRMGPGRAGHMSFPMEGWTLACDIRAGDAGETAIRALYDDVAEAGGRIYLAKDALAGGAMVRAMYPEHADWLAEADRLDPNAAYATGLTRRLELRGTS